ncbi:MAG: hypothetical protein AAF720_12555 [Pseudomonadota bacterium]
MTISNLTERGALSLKKKAMFLTVAVAASTSSAMAFTAPAAGSLGYDLYDIVVNQGILGPVGFMAAVIMLVIGAGSLVRGAVLPGIFGIIGAAAVFSADQVVTTLGFVI